MQREMDMGAKHAMWLHAKSFLAGPRSYLASRRELEAMGNQVERWADLTNFDAAWDERTKLIAGMIVPNSAVLEFGSGREQLEAFLPEGCSYQPADIVARSPRTMAANLNEGFPALTRRYDVIVFSGVLEYIHDLEPLLREVRRHADGCILSYATTDDLDCVATRMRNGWVHHYSLSQLLPMIERAGFRVTETKHWNAQVILRLT